MINAKVTASQRKPYLVSIGSCKNMTISTDRCVGARCRSQYQFKITIPIEDSSLQSESNDADQMNNKEGYHHDSIAISEMRRNEMQTEPISVISMQYR